MERCRNSGVMTGQQRNSRMPCAMPHATEGSNHKRHKRHRILCFLCLLWLLPGCSMVTSKQLENGQALYELHCIDCHEMPPPDLLKQPPKLAHLFAKKTLPSGAPATDEQIRKTIIGGRNTMPAFKGRLREDEIRDLIAYLHTFK